MSIQIQEKTEHLTHVTSALGGVGLLIAESEKNRDKVFEQTGEALINNNYKECSDYLEIMDVLSEGKDRIFYAEKEKRLDSLVLEIIAEFEAGIVSLADRKNNTGLKTAKWNPSAVSFIVVMTRDQVENSYPRLFEYIHITESI